MYSPQTSNLKDLSEVTNIEQELKEAQETIANLMHNIASKHKTIQQKRVKWLVRKENMKAKLQVQCKLLSEARLNNSQLKMEITKMKSKIKTPLPCSKHIVITLRKGGLKEKWIVNKKNITFTNNCVNI